MERYKLYLGETLTEEMYLKTWELDNTIFEGDDVLTKQLALDWFYLSNKSTIVMWDQIDKKLVGYVTPFLVTKQFSHEYVTTKTGYKQLLTPQNFCKPGDGVEADIYLFSMVIVEEYRNKRINDKKSKYYGSMAIKVLFEGMCEWLCDVILKGTKIEKVYSDGVTFGGTKGLKLYGFKPCFEGGNSTKSHRDFSAKMFRWCNNYKKLENVLKDKNTQ